jgi:hypothetical protein
MIDNAYQSSHSSGIFPFNSVLISLHIPYPFLSFFSFKNWKKLSDGLSEDIVFNSLNREYKNTYLSSIFFEKSN